MDPNYSTYSEIELREALSSIDKVEFPERVAKLENELAKRVDKPSTSQSTDYEIVDSSKKFYACPTCDKKISLFSKAINKWGKVKNCPHCGEPFISKVDIKFALLMLIPAFVLNSFLLRPVLVSFELTPSIGTGITVVLLILLSTRLKKVLNYNAT